MKYVILLLASVLAVVLLSLMAWCLDKLEESNQKQITLLAHLSGSSMEQYGFFDGDTVRITNYAPKEGDFASFRCIAERCKDQEQPMIKKVVKIENECYWLQGRDDVWLDEDGKKVHSYDSRDYGWLCPGEIAINGVVTENLCSHSKSTLNTSKKSSVESRSTSIIGSPSPKK